MVCKTLCGSPCDNTMLIFSIGINVIVDSIIVTITSFVCLCKSFFKREIHLFPMNIKTIKGPTTTMSSMVSLVSILAKIFGVILMHEANQSKCGQWFIINFESNDDVNILAGFLGLSFDDFVLLFEEVGLFETITLLQSSQLCFNYANMNAIITDIDDDKIELTQSKVTSTLIPIKKYYAIWIGPKRAQAETLPQQIKRAPWSRGKAVKETKLYCKN